MSEGRAGPRTPSTGWLLALGAVSLALYAQNWRDYFVGDDFDLIHSFFAKPAGYFPALLWTNESGEVWKSWGIDPELGRGYLRPIKIWLLALDFAIWGTNPLGYHLASSAFFAAIVLLVFAILRRTTPERPVLAAAGACSVALHPIFAEVVPFITAREELVATAFGLAAFLQFVRFREEGRSPALFHVFYALAVLTKETGIVFLALPLGWDLAQRRIVPPSRERAWDLARSYAPSAGILVVYFSLRWIAFGNFVGGEGKPTQYLSPAHLVAFHARFWRSLADPTLLSLGGVPGAPALVAGLGGALVAAAAWCAARVPERRRRDLLFYGPLWYAASTAILHGAYFAVRHNLLPVIGLLMFAALATDTLLACGLLRRPRLAALGLVAVSGALFLPPTLATGGDWRATAAGVAAIRATVEARTAGLASPCAVRLSGVPQWVIPPYFFGWGLLSALQRPFTASDLARVCTVIDSRNLELTRVRPPLPERYDAVVKLRPKRWVTPELRERYVMRLWRDGAVREGEPLP